MINEKYENTITADDSGLHLRLGEIWRYKDLLFLFVKRDFVSKYKQTVLGPVWFFIQPLFQTVVMAVVFGGMAKLSTDGVPPLLFYLAGVTAWNYFANCLKSTSTTFTANAGLFGKVYFPRAIAPLSIIVSNLIQFIIGLALFLCVYIFFFANGYNIQPTWALLLLPLLIMTMGLMGLGLGMLVTAFTTRYRDLQYLVEFGIQLAMYSTPIIIPLSAVPDRYQFIMLANPMTGVIETFKYAFLGAGVFSWINLFYSFGFTIIVSLWGLLVFNKTEKNFMDTV